MRLLRKSPIFTLAVVVSLALGIGANTAIFSLINAVMWRTLPVKDPESLVLLTHSRGSTFTGGFTYQQYRIMRQQGGGFSELAAWSSSRLNVSVDGSLEPTTDGQLVSGNYFSLLGVTPIAGRSDLWRGRRRAERASGCDDQLRILETPLRVVSVRDRT